MHTSYDSLKAGLRCHASRSGFSDSVLDNGDLIILTILASNIVEGNATEKKAARAEIKRLIGRGRRALNAADFNAGLKKGQSSVCGNPAYAEPCQNPNEGECGDCLALPPAMTAADYADRPRIGQQAAPPWSACCEIMGAQIKTECGDCLALPPAMNAADYADRPRIGQQAAVQFCKHVACRNCDHITEAPTRNTPCKNCGEVLAFAFDETQEVA